MRDPKRIKRIIEKLEYIWSREPDSRLCQLVYNTAYRTGDVCTDTNDIFYVEDNVFEAVLDELIKQIKERVN